MCLLNHLIDSVLRGNAVMPLDVLGRTRATLTEPASLPWPRGFWGIL
jgi:hypothetical protein